MSQQSAIYNHRPLQPSGAAPPPQGPAVPPNAAATASSVRFLEGLDITRQEFEALSAECFNLKAQRDEYESRVGGQVNELNIIRQALYDLENSHMKIRQDYEKEVTALRSELQALHQQQLGHHPPPGAPIHSSQPPPAGLALSSMPPSHAPHHPGYPPPSSAGGPSAASDPYYSKAPPNYRNGPPPHPDDTYPPHGPPTKRAREPDRDRPLDRTDAMQIDQPERDRDREVRERERETQREREREMRERADREAAATRASKKTKAPTGPEREQLPPPRPASAVQGYDRDHPQSSGAVPAGSNLPPHMPPSGGPTGPVHGPPPPPGFVRDPPHYQEDVKNVIPERERERERAERERADKEQREREKRERERAERERERERRVPVAAPESTTSAGAALPPSYTAPAPAPVAPTPTPTEQPAAPTPSSPPHTATNGAEAAANGSTSQSSDSGLTMAALMDMEPENVPAHLKKEGSDWFAVFNPQTPRKLDIKLKLSLAHESVVCCVRFSADGNFLATGCNKTAQIYDTKTGARTCVLNDESVTRSGDLYIRSVCFSPDGKLLATGAEDKQIRIWDIATKTIRKVFTGHLQEIYSLDFSRDGKLIVSGSGDKTARVWDMETGAHKTLAILEPETVDAGVTSVAISADGQYVAAGSLDTIVRIWDVASGSLIERLRGHLDSVYSVAFTPDGKGLVSGSLDKTLKLWDLGPLIRSPARGSALSQGGPTPTGQQPVTKEGGEKGSTCKVAFAGHKDYVLSVAVSPDGQWVVSGSKDRGVQFWDPKTGLPQLMLQGHKNSVISIDLSPVTSPSGGLLASGSGDYYARVWSYMPV